MGDVVAGLLVGDEGCHAHRPSTSFPQGLFDTDGQWIARHLRDNYPDLLALVEDELSL